MIDQAGSTAGAIIALALLAGIVPGACERAGGAPSAGPTRVADGVWGATGVRLDVDGATVSIEFDCAHGALEGPLSLDDRQRFSVSGSFVRERPGPVRENEEPVAQDASYSGQLEGRRLTLTVRTGETEVGSFTLTHGQSPALRKCG